MSWTTEGSRSGFTLLEIVVAVSVLVGLMAVLVPAVFGERESAERARAVADARVIGRALGAYLEDTRLAPTGNLGEARISALHSDHGELPALAPGDRSGTFRKLGVVTFENTWRHPRWRGPYLQPQGPDPWGRAYVAWVANYHRPRPVFVLSAGPNGLLDTGPDDDRIRADDIGVRME